MTTPVPVDHTPPVAAPGRVGQGTAVEQSRAIAQVQAAVVIAQQNPRRLSSARTEMQQSCGMLALAERAFFRYGRAGSTVAGPTIHLARELARCWGNVDYGIVELRRDDDHGQSEMLAFAWDLQTNARSSNTFIVPHLRDKTSGAERLTSARDIYENNANMGARRVRQALYSILPPWYVDEAQTLCKATLERGDGRPLPERIAGAIAAYDALGVPVARLEQKLGRASERWTVHDIAQLVITHRSIDRGEITVEDEFPPRRVTVDEIDAQHAGTAAGDTAAAQAPAAAPVEYSDDDPERPM